MVLVVHTCLIQKMRKVCLRLREIYFLARWNQMESYSSLCIRTYDVILLGYTCVPGFHIGGHILVLKNLNENINIDIDHTNHFSAINTTKQKKQQSMQTSLATFNILLFRQASCSKYFLPLTYQGPRVT